MQAQCNFEAAYAHWLEQRLHMCDTAQRCRSVWQWTGAQEAWKDSLCQRSMSIWCTFLKALKKPSRIAKFSRKCHIQHFPWHSITLEYFSLDSVDKRLGILIALTNPNSKKRVTWPTLPWMNIITLLLENSFLTSVFGPSCTECTFTGNTHTLNARG